MLLIKLLDFFIFRRSEVDGLLDEADFINQFCGFCHGRTKINRSFLAALVQKKFIKEKQTIAYNLFRRYKETTAFLLENFKNKIVKGETLSGLQNSLCRFWNLSKRRTIIRFPFTGRLNTEGINFLGMRKGITRYTGFIISF